MTAQTPVRAELVEAPFFFGTIEKQPFDKLRANGRVRKPQNA
jgi:hypothetical protein